MQSQALVPRPQSQSDYFSALPASVALAILTTHLGPLSPTARHLTVPAWNLYLLRGTVNLGNAFLPYKADFFCVLDVEKGKLYH